MICATLPTVTATTATAAPPSLRHRYQNALYLNNAAVSLLSRGDYAFAAQAAKAALYLLKTLVPPPPILDKNGDVRQRDIFVTNEFEQRAVTKTAQRLAQGRCRSTTMDDQHRHRLIRVVTYDGSLDSVVLQQAAALVNANCNGSTTRPMLLAIQVDDWTILECDSPPMSTCKSNPDNDATEAFVSAVGTASALALNHLALAHWCQQDDRRVYEENLDCHEAALQLLDNALSVMGVTNRTMTVNEGNLCIALAMVANLCTVTTPTLGSTLHDDFEHEQRHEQHHDLAMLVELSYQWQLCDDGLFGASAA